LKEIQQLPAILQHSKDIFTLYIQALLTFSGTTISSHSAWSQWGGDTPSGHKVIDMDKKPTRTRPPKASS
jgi:hypothetical protein